MRIQQRTWRNVKPVRAFLTFHSECSLELLRSSYLQRLDSQLQRSRFDRENLFNFERATRIGRLVENGDASEFGNDSFEQLQALAPHLSGKVRNPRHPPPAPAHVSHHASL